MIQIISFIDYYFFYVLFVFGATTLILMSFIESNKFTNMISSTFVLLSISTIPLMLLTNKILHNEKVFPENSCYDRNKKFYNELSIKLQNKKIELKENLEEYGEKWVKSKKNFLYDEIKDIEKELISKGQAKIIILEYSKNKDENLVYSYKERQYIENFFPSLIDYKRVDCQSDQKIALLNKFNQNI